MEYTNTACGILQMFHVEHTNTRCGHSVGEEYWNIGILDTVQEIHLEHTNKSYGHPAEIPKLKTGGK